MRWLKTFCLVVLFLPLCGAEKKMTTADIKPLCDQIFSYHVEYREFNKTLARRSLKIFVEPLDQTSLYILADESVIYEGSDENFLHEVVKNYQVGQFGQYRQMLSQMQNWIARSRQLRQKMYHDFIAAAPREGGINSLKLNKPTTSEELIENWKQYFIFWAESVVKEEGLSLKDVAVRKRIATAFEERRQRFERTFLPAGYKSPHLFEESFALMVSKSIAKSLDAHTSIYTWQEAQDIRASLQKQFCGIGIALQEGLYGFKIASVIDGGSAQKSEKIHKGDFLVAVDHQPLNDQTSFEEVLEKLRGPAKSHVILTIKPKNGSKSYDVDLVREQIVLGDQLLKVQKIPHRDGQVAVLSFNSFYDDGQKVSLEQDIKEAMQGLAVGVPLYGVVLDMRENAGGFLHQALRLCSLYIPQGVVVIAKYANDQIEYTRHQQSKGAYQIPLVVLTSKGSASAAEIVAQTLQDYGVAIVVGDSRTYGKGTMQLQTITDERAAYPFKVTIGRYYTISGRSTQLRGVQADIVVPTVYSPYLIGEKYLEYPLSGDNLTFQVGKMGKSSQSALSEELTRLFRYSLSARERGVRRHLPALIEKSRYRMSSDPRYHQMLMNLERAHAAILDNLSKSYPSEAYDKSGADLTLLESVAILQDLVDLEVPQVAEAAS